jgi:hypothetical protein
MARRQVSIFVNGKEVAASLNQVYAEKRKINAELNKMVVGSDTYEAKVKELRRLDGVLTGHREKLRGVESTWGKLSGTVKAGIAGFVGGVVSQAVGALASDIFNLGKEMEVLGKKAETVFGGALPLVTREAERNAAAMGLTISQYTDAATAIGDLLIPMGFQREEAANISTELVNLSGALAEWTGGQVSAEEVTKILGKAVLGEREQLKSLGIAISEADVSARLAEKGLKGLTGEMLQQAKAAVTLELITEKSVDAQTAYINNSDTLIRKQAALSAQFNSLKESIATALIPVFSRLLDVASNVSNSISKMGDPIKRATSAFDEQTQKVQSLEKDLLPLLARYDELSKRSNLSAEEQKELGDVINRIGEITPTAITEIDEYGRVLRINAQASREFYEAERARLEFVNQKGIATIEKQIKSLEGLRDIEKEFVQTGKDIRAAFQGGFPLTSDQEAEKIDNARKKVADFTRQIQGAAAELARLRGQPLPGGGDGPAGSTAPPVDLAAEARRQEQAEAAKKAAIQRQKDREKEAEREAADLQRQLERLQEIEAKARQQAELALLDDNNRKLEIIRIQFDEQIALAQELEAKGIQDATASRIELERLRDEAIQAELDRLSEEAFKKEQERVLKEEERRKELMAQLKAEADEILLEERELEILRTQEQFAALIAEAEKYGVDTSRLQEALRLRLLQINGKFNEEELKQAEQLTAALGEIVQSRLGIVSDLADGLGQLFEENSDAAMAVFFTQKALAIAETIISLQKELAGIAASNAALGPAAPPVIAALSTAAQIRAGIRIGIITATTIGKIAQRKEGGWLSVTGQDDNTTYRARYIGEQPTGMLPSHPVVVSTVGGPVLASERGSEYFVSNSALRHPAVMNHVRAIDNIARTKQMASGGFTTPLPSSSGSDATGIDPRALNEMMQINARLLAILEAGIYARVDDQFIVDMRARQDKLSRASGGVM